MPKSPPRPRSASGRKAGRGEPPPSPERDDPRPLPPVEPALEDCCRSGCAPCVFDLHDAALERYEAALAAWRARHPEA